MKENVPTFKMCKHRDHEHRLGETGGGENANTETTMCVH